VADVDPAGRVHGGAYHVLYYVLYYVPLGDLMPTQNVHNVELQAFAQGAAKEILRRGQLIEFLRALGLDPRPYGQGHKVICPACKTSAVYVGTGGGTHEIFWKCYSAACPTTSGPRKAVKNVVGLVRLLLPDGGLVPAIKRISDFLGVSNPFDITNGRLPASSPSPAPVPDDDAPWDHE
jgi:hypothetical protein